MFTLTAPSEDEIRRFISKQSDSGFSYPEVGASATAVPTGYNVDHNRIQLDSEQQKRFVNGGCSACHG